MVVRTRRRGTARRGDHQVAVIIIAYTRQRFLFVSRVWQTRGLLQQPENARANVSPKAKVRALPCPPKVPAHSRQRCPCPTRSSLFTSPTLQRRWRLLRTTTYLLRSPFPLLGRNANRSGVLSDDASDSAAKPAKKKRGRRLKAQSDSESEEVVQKPPRKKPGPKPKPKPKAVPKAKPARSCSTLFVPKPTPIDFFRKQSTRLGRGERRNGRKGENCPTMYAHVLNLPSFRDDRNH